MKKKIVVLIGICCLFCLPMLSPKASGNDFHLGSDWCTCKRGDCQDGNFFGFRETCGTATGGDLGCTLKNGQACQKGPQ